MAAISDSQLPLVKRLYYRNLCSAREIAQILNVTLFATYYCMRKHGLKRRTFSEQNHVRFMKKKPSFFPKTANTLTLKELKVAGVFLYWAEGYKRGHLVDFTNSDVEIIKIFMKFLRR